MTTQTAAPPMSALSAKDAPRIAASAGHATLDRIAHLKLSSIKLPLTTPISDAKVLTGRQKPMTEIVLLFAEIAGEAGYGGIGFSYSKRAGGPAQYAHAREVADGLLGERGPQRHRPCLPEAALGRCLRGPQRGCYPSHRGP